MDKLPSSRSPEAVDAISLTRVSGVPEGGSSVCHCGGPGSSWALMENANSHLGAQVSHQLRNA